MKKGLEYYLRLPYKIEIIGIPENKGGGYLARLPQFGELGIVGDGETIEQAIEDLEENKKIRFQEYLDDGLVIPEPEADDNDFSGRFVLRMPKFLHRELAQSAKKNGTSLNQYVCTLLAMNFQSDKLSFRLTALHDEIRSLHEPLGTLRYRMDMGKDHVPPSVSGFYADEYPAVA